MMRHLISFPEATILLVSDGKNIIVASKNEIGNVFGSEAKMRSVVEMQEVMAARDGSFI